jgi:uncharacterized membrane protein YeaQ/YmgE (transglycosylase-associated protein family)
MTRDEVAGLGYRVGSFNNSEHTMTSLFVTLFVGLIVGALARWVMPGEQKMGWILTILLGVAGSVLASFLGQALGWYAQGQAAGWIMSVLGAVLLLFVVGKLRKGS